MQTITDFGLSNDNIKSMASAEVTISGCKAINKENVEKINESKIQGQYVPFIVHTAKFPRTKSGNVSKAVTSAMYDDLINHVGLSKSNAKLLKENSVKFCEFFDVPTQATPELVQSIINEHDLHTQIKLGKKVSGKKEVTLAEQIARKVYGKEVTKKVDGVDQTIFIPTDLTMDEIEQIEEHMADIKRVRKATDEANQAKLAETNQDNQETNELLDTLTA